jgi:hypothetical protein
VTLGDDTVHAATDDKAAVLITKRGEAGEPVTTQGVPMLSVPLIGQLSNSEWCETLSELYRFSKTR